MKILAMLTLDYERIVIFLSVILAGTFHFFRNRFFKNLKHLSLVMIDIVVKFNSMMIMNYLLIRIIQNNNVL